AVKLESVHPGRTRYLVVVSCMGRQDAEESCLLGIDCHARATVGLVLRVLADTAITLDGDGLNEENVKEEEENDDNNNVYVDDDDDDDLTDERKRMRK
ncbi:hypothetical protein PV326_009237, partial [Microctonus aethiopoides]